MSAFRTRFLRTTFFLISLFPAGVFADEGGADASRPREFSFKIRSQGKIDDLIWFRDEVRTEERAENGRSAIFVVLPGQTQKLAGGTFIYTTGDSLKVARIDEETGKFQILIPVEAERIHLRLKAIDSYGKVIDDRTFLDVKSQETARGFFADVGTSLSLLDYSEDQAGTKVSIRELGLTTKLNVGYRFTPRWDFSGNTFITAIPLMLSASPAGAGASRWYGINGRAGYALYRRGLDTSLSLALGWYFWGMISPLTGPVYGVQRLSGPQAFLIYRSVTRSNHAYFAYLKLAAIQGFEGYDVQNREVAIGGGYQPWTHSEVAKKWSLTFDLALTKFERFQLLSVSSGLSRKIW
jgi:hypothetical protein